MIANLESTAETTSAALARYKSEMTAPTDTAKKQSRIRQTLIRTPPRHARPKLMSAQEQDEAEGEMKLAEAELKLAQENKEAAKLEWQQQSSLLALHTLRSPFDGGVVDQILYPSEVVEPSGQKNPS